MEGKGNGIRKSKRDWVNELVSSGDGKERWYGERNRRFGVLMGVGEEWKGELGGRWKGKGGEVASGGVLWISNSFCMNGKAT